MEDIFLEPNGAMTIQEIKFTKFFDVKSPKAEALPEMYNNAGIDLYMPRMTKEFLLALYEANQIVYGNKLSVVIESYIDTKNLLFDEVVDLRNAIENANKLVTENPESETIFDIFNTDKFKVFFIINVPVGTQTVMYYSADDKTYHFQDRMQIPLGVAIAIPAGCYVDLRSKSGNFKNGYYEITGLIDCCYTYGMGVQLVPYNGKILQSQPVIMADEKITQIVLNQFVAIYNCTEMPIKEWNDSEGIKIRREKRTGGFGSTGKF